jgi:hypothetical protein
MDTLLTTELIFNGQSQIFTVSFHDDKYIFQALNSSTQFSLRREEDEWHTSEPIDNQLKTSAIEKLETYLLSQH